MSKLNEETPERHAKAGCQKVYISLTEAYVLEHAMPRETGATKGSTHQHTHYVCDTSLRKERVCHKPETMEGRLMTPILMQVRSVRAEDLNPERATCAAIPGSAHACGNRRMAASYHH